MAEKGKDKTPNETIIPEPAQAESKFTKAKLLKCKRISRYINALRVVLDENTLYTVSEAEKLAEKFLRMEVK